MKPIFWIGLVALVLGVLSLVVPIPTISWFICSPKHPRVAPAPAMPRMQDASLRGCPPRMARKLRAPRTLC
jgi:hypothetical protein